MARSHRAAGAAPASHVVLRSSFRPVRAGVGNVLASGDDLLSTIPNIAGGHDVAPVVINDRLGTTTALDPSCDAQALGPPWVLMECPQSSVPYGPYDVELYSLPDGTRQIVKPTPGMPYCSSPPYDPEVICRASAVGADWIEWVASSYHHLPTSDYFQNIQTGALRRDPTNATTFADLNSPALARRTCPGVRLIATPPGSEFGWGSLTVYGQYALVSGPGNEAFLERCATHRRRLLISATGASPVLASNPSAIVWQSAPDQLTGLLLPSLQTFTIALPTAIVKPPGASQDLPVSARLTSGALYVKDSWTGALWRAAAPSALPLNTSRPTLTRSGAIMTCGRGRWRNADRFSYTWRVNGTTINAAKPRLRLARSRQRRSVVCSVAAANTMGTTTAVSAPLDVRATLEPRPRRRRIRHPGRGQRRASAGGGQTSAPP